MPGTDRDLVSRLLKESILALCREAVTYRNSLEVDGIICVTLDNQIDHVVKIHKLFSKPEQSSCSSSDSPSTPGTSTKEGVTFAQQDKQSHAQKTTNMGSVSHQMQPKPSFSAPFEVKIEPVSTSYEPNEASPSVAKSAALVCPPQTEAQSASRSAVLARSNSVTPNPLEVSKAKHIPCKKCSAILNDAKAFETHNTDAHGHFTCMVCLATFTSRNNMKRHLRLHTGVKPYTCIKCSESFARNDDFKRHLLRHSFEKPFRCVVCKSGYSDRSCVKNHMAKEHGSKVFHICPQCGLSYIDSAKFQMHKKTHPELQDFRCELCSFTGSNSLMYNKHMLTHGPPKRYVCGHCEVSFNDPFSYTTHMKRHKGDDLVQTYICCFCEHVAPTFEQFQRHEHSHIQSRQHTCNICEKQFRYPSNLREHMLTHMAKTAMAAPTVPQRDPVVLERVSIRAESSAVAERDDSLDEQARDDTIAEATREAESGEMDEDGQVEMGACESDGSDYWCTECNQGFGSEDLLQDHITSTHEDISEISESPIDHADSETMHNNSGDADDYQSNVSGGSNPYELNTQVDSPGSTSLYGEDTCPVTSDISTVSGARKRGYDAEFGAFDEATQIEVGSKVAGWRGTPKAARRPAAYDEETVTDGDTRYQDDVADEQEHASPVPFSNAEIKIVENAMKEVQKIQSKFGIKSDAGNMDTVASVASMNDSQLRRALKIDKDKIGFKTPSSGIRKSPVSINRNRLLVSPQLDINRNDIPGSCTEAEDLSMGRDKAVLGEARSSSADVVSAVPSDMTEKSRPNADGLLYSKTSVLGMDTDFSSSPNRSSPTTLNLKMKSPGFEKVITPKIHFKDRAPFTCEICQENFDEFSGSGGFDQHGISVHRRYICSWCGKPFTSRPNRERHVRYHTGEKPYRCDVCTAAFFRGDDLKYHRTTKHADIRPFHCATCKAAFAVPKELENHLRVYPLHRMTNDGTGATG